MARLLLSHSLKDEPFVRELAEDLRAAGYEVTLDGWEIRANQPVTTRNSAGLGDARAVILALTQSAVVSNWIDEAWKAAYWDQIQQRNLPLLAILLDNCEIPLMLHSAKVVDFRGERYLPALAQLVAVINRSMQVGPVAPAQTIAVESSSGLAEAPAGPASEIWKLLQKTRSQQAPLSHCISEALTIAQRYEDATLIEFCQNELRGWGDHGPAWRSGEFYFNTGPEFDVKPWPNAAAIMEHMRSHPEQFIPWKFCSKAPIMEIERKPAPGPNSYVSMRKPLKDVVPSADDPDRIVTGYGPGDLWMRIASQIRHELSQRLEDLMNRVTAGPQS